MFKIGDNVKFKSDSHASYWFIKENKGVITDIKQSYQKLEGQMIYARFGEKNVYAAYDMFEPVLDSEKEPAT